MMKLQQGDRKREIAKRLQRDVIQMIYHSQSGHPGGALGVAEIITEIYFYRMKHDPRNPGWEDRDRFVLSNGHLCAILYSALARTGYFPTEELLTFRRIDSRLQGHPSRRELSDIETAAGPLGQGLSIANGMALGLRMQQRGSKVYCLVGDGEIQEGQFWEAVMTTSQYRLNNICLIVNYNGLQIDGSVSEVKEVQPIEDKLRAFGWDVCEIDGHDFEQIECAFDRFDVQKDHPFAIIARTHMGHGVSFMQDRAEWHGKAPSREQAIQALQEIGPTSFGTDLLVL